MMELAQSAGKNVVVEPSDSEAEYLKQHLPTGFGGTPTLINEAGDRTAGALPLDKLEAFINAPLQGN